MCRFCAATCGVVVRVEGGRVTKVSGDPDHPVSQGYACSKGRRLGELHHDPDRLDRALVGRPGARRTVALDAALDDLAAGLAAARAAGGPDAVGTFLGGGGYFEKGLVGLAADWLRRLGSRSSYSTLTLDNAAKPVVSQLLTGTGAVVAPVVDWDHADTILLVGTNPIVSHGHDWAFPDPIRRLRALRDRGAEVWVVDPRRTETAAHATVHLAVRPGTDHELLAHLVRALLDADPAYLAAHATGVEALRRAVDPFTRARVVERTGVDGALLDRLVDRIRTTGRVSGRSGTGLTMGPAPAVAEWLLLALHVVTGSMERPGGLWFNPDFFARQDLVPPPPAPVAEPGPASRPELPRPVGQHPCAALCDEIEAGHLRALIVLGGNPAVAVPDTARVRRALASLDVLAVLDIRLTATTDLATHVLPCTGPLEHDTLSYARMGHRVHGQYVARVVEPTGDRHPQWWHLARLGERLGVPVGDGPATEADHLRAVAGPHVDLDALRAAPHGIDLGPPGPWVEDHVLPGGRWQLAPPVLVGQLASLATDAGGGGLVLVPRRQPRHLNSVLHGRDTPALLLHPDDARSCGLADGDGAELVGPAGVVRCTVQVTETVRPGTVSLPHGYEATNVNGAVPAEADPVTGMVRLTAVPVSVRRPA